LTSQDVGGAGETQTEPGAMSETGFAEGALSMEDILDAVYRAPRRRALETPEPAEPGEALDEADQANGAEMGALGALEPLEHRVRVVRRRSRRRRSDSDDEPLIKPRDVLLAMIVLIAIAVFMIMRK